VEAVKAVRLLLLLLLLQSWKQKITAQECTCSVCWYFLQREAADTIKYLELHKVRCPEVNSRTKQQKIKAELYSTVFELNFVQSAPV
jgi:hypothetical protein